MTPGSAAVLVVSCDKYADVWSPFFRFFRKAWPDCPFPVFLGSNFQDVDVDGVHSLCIGPDRSWTDNVRLMVDRVEAEYVLLMLEDFFLEQPVATVGVIAALGLLRREGADCIRLGDANVFNALTSGSSPVRDRGRPHRWQALSTMPGFSRVAGTGDYSVSTQATLWRRDSLLRALLPGASAWEFEEIGSQLRPEAGETYLACDPPLLVYDHAIEKGRWKASSLELCARMGVSVDASARGVYPRAEIERHYAEQARLGAAADARRRVFDAAAEGDRLALVSAAARVVSSEVGSVANWLLFGLALTGPGAVRAARRRRLQARLDAIAARSRPSSSQVAS